MKSYAYLVLDNSIVARWLLQDGSPKDRLYARKVLDLLEGGVKAIVPPIFSLEIANVIARAERLGQIQEAASTQFIEILEAMDFEIDFQSQVKTLSTTLNLARRYQLSSYDASYLEIALRRGVPLVSLDKDLSSAFKAAGGLKFDAKIFSH